MRYKSLFYAAGFIGMTLLPAAAYAEISGPYFGGSWGMYQFEDPNLDEEDSMWKAFIGAQFTNWLGVEASYVVMDRAEKQGSTFEAEGFTAAAVLSFPLGQRSSLYAKGGAFWWDAERSGPVTVDNDEADPFWGAGFRVGLSENFSLRLEYERYEVVDTDIDTASVGLQVNF